MSIVRHLSAACLITAGVLAFSAAQANDVRITPNCLGDTTSSSPDKAHNCFYLSQWQNWHAPSPDVIYLRVRMNDIYKVQLSHAEGLLQDPFARIVSREHGDDAVCAPIDLNLSVSADENGFSAPLFVKSITKLTAVQIAAIPPNDLP